MLLEKRVFRFCKELEKVTDYVCYMKSVAKTNKYDDYTFTLNGVEVKPTVYTGIFIDLDSTCDHRGDGDFWYTGEAEVKMFVELDGKFYIPKHVDEDYPEMIETTHELQDDAEDWIHNKYNSDISYFDPFVEEKFDKIIELKELYQKCNFSDKFHSALKTLSRKTKMTCLYPSVHEFRNYRMREETEYFLGDEKIIPEKMYEGIWIDNSDDVKDGAYNGFEMTILESNGDYYLMKNGEKREMFDFYNKKTSKFVYQLNKYHLCKSKVKSLKIFEEFFRSDIIQLENI